MHTCIHIYSYKYMHTHPCGHFRQRCHICLEVSRLMLWVGNVGVALIMRMLISFNVDIAVAVDERAHEHESAMLVDSQSTHTHTCTGTGT